MTTQYTTILKLALPVQGELSGTWGDVVNNNITQMVEQAIAGKATVNSWTANSHTLTTADGTTSESRCAILELTDSGTALTGAGTVVCPTNTKLYIVDNNTAQIVTVKTSGGTGIAVPVGKTMLVYCDGTNVVEGVTHANSLSLGTSTVTADKILDEDNMASDSATAIATQQSIKAYVDSQVGSFDTLAEVLAQGNTTGGTDIAVSTGDDITFADNSKAIFGAGSDLQIYHDGNHSRIVESGSGDMIIQGDEFSLMNVAGTEYMIFADNDSFVKLYYDGSAKLATTTSGIDVTGDIVLGDNNPTITMNDSSVVNLQHLITSSSDNLIIAADNNDVDAGTEIQFYVDGVERMATTASGIQVTGDISNASGDLTIDVAGRILLDADTDGNVRFLNSGTLYGQIFQSTDMYIRSTVADKNLIFQGNDNGINIAALTLDMSNAGAATFNGTIAGTRISLSDGVDDAGSAGSESVFNNGGTTADFRVESDGNANMLFVDGGANRVGVGRVPTSDQLEVAGNLKLQADNAEINLRSGVQGTSGAINWTFNTDDTDFASIKLPYDTRASVGLHMDVGYPIRIDSSSATGITFLAGATYNVFAGTYAVFNEGGADVDFRIESASTGNQFFLDGGTGLIGINDGSPSNHLDINGSLSFERVSSRNISSGAAANNFFVIYDLDFQSSAFNTNQHIIRIIAAGSTSGQMASADLLVTFKQQSGSKFFNIVPIQNDNLTLGYIWNASGGGTSNGNLKIYCQGPAAYSYVQVYANNRDGNPTDNIIQGTFPMTDTGSASAPAGMTAIESPLNYSGNKYNQNGRVDNTFVINEGGHDINFRVESDSNTSMLFVDAGNDRVGIATSVPDQSLDIGSGGLQIKGNIASPASGVSAMQVDYFQGGARYWSRGADVGVRGTHKFYTLTNTGGSQITPLVIDNTGGVIINEDSADADFRVESDSHAYAIYMNAANGTTAFGSSTPQTAYNFIGVGGVYVNNGNQPSGDFMSIDAEGSAGATKMTFYRYDSSATTYQNRFAIAGETSETVVNESGVDVDFRVESDGNANMIFVDASANFVALGNTVANPASGFSATGGVGYASGGGMQIANNSSGASLVLGQNFGTNGSICDFRKQSTLVGSISVTGAATAYNTSSDQRLKENIVDAPDAGDLIDAIQVRQFDWIVDGEHQRYGMVAQELNAVAPEAVSAPENPDEMMGVDYSKLVPMLIKEIQSLRARVADLES